MKVKKLLALILIFTLAAPVFSGGFSAYAKSGTDAGIFSIYDKARDGFLSGESENFTLAESEKYIVGFDKDAPEERIASALSEISHQPISYSSERVFLVAADMFEQFARDYADIISYSVKDSENDVFFGEGEIEPAERINVSGLTDGGDGVTIAILDSGIERNLPCFENADISDGYDAITGSVGVYHDTTGHGTRIAGIIVSDDLGIAKKSTVMPIKITTGTESVLTSALVSAIYYAVDMGADIINMSFGGYSDNPAERNAIEYAREKGVILIASAGNEGKDPELAGKPAYPASYDGVISTASCDLLGNPSAFSQYNEFVDITAPGQSITVHNSDGEYITVSGTSYSAAFVTAVCAVCVSKSKRDLDSDAFETLIRYSANTKRNDFTGYGIIDAKSLIASLSKPIVTGIYNGEVYFTDVAAHFENAMAFLDGEEYESDDVIFSQGLHTLKVYDDIGYVSIEFTVDTVPLLYEYKNNAVEASFVFSYGTATCDGRPYSSGASITGYGTHTFTLTGKYGNSVSESFVLSPEPPSVYGFENAETYDRAIDVLKIGEGTVKVDGTDVENSLFVTEKGNHTVTVYDTAGNEKAMTFSINKEIFTEILTFDDGYSVTLCGNRFALWKKGTRYIYIVNDGINENTVETDSEIVGVSFDGYLDVCTENRYTRYDIEAETDYVVDEKQFETPVNSAIVENGIICVSDVNGYLTAYDGEKEITFGKNLGGVSFDSENGIVYAYSVYTPKTVYMYKDGTFSEITLSYAPGYYSISVCNDRIAVGETVYDIYGNRLCEFESPVLFVNDMILSANSLYDREFGIIGHYGIVPNEIAVSENNLYLITENKIFLINDTVYYGTAKHENIPFGEALDSGIISKTFVKASGTDIKNAVYDVATGLTAVLPENSRELLFIEPETGKVVTAKTFSEIPSDIIATENGVLVTFSNSGTVFLYGEFISFGRSISSACIAGGVVYAVSKGKIYKFAADGITPIAPDLEADSIAGDGNTLYAFSHYDITAIDTTTMQTKAVCFGSFRGKPLCTENYIAVGNILFDKATLTEVARCDSDILAVKGNAVITENGLFDVSKGITVATVKTKTKIAVFLPDFSSLLFTEISFEYIPSDKSDPTLIPIIEGISDGETRFGDTYIRCGGVMTFCDGEEVNNDFTVKGAGTHTVITVNAWGNTASVTFTLKYKPLSISVTNPKAHINVGESITLDTELYPSGAEGKMTFTALTDNITVSENGIVTAISQGDGIVSVAIPEYGIETTFTVYVTDTQIVCTNPDYKTDISAGIIYGIKPYTDVNIFLSEFEVYDCHYTLKNSDGYVTDGNVITGSVVERHSSDGTVTDSLTVSVVGDLDGDGAVSINDADILFSALSSGSPLSDTAYRSADLNGNGKVTYLDFKQLRKSISSVSAKSDDSLRLFVNMPYFVHTDDVFYITLRNDYLGNTDAVNGVLLYDTDKFEYVGAEALVGELYTENSNGKLSYSVYGISGNKPQTLLCRLKFKAKSECGDASFVFAETRISNNGLYSLADLERHTDIRDTNIDSLTVILNNGKLDFDKSVYEYNVEIPLSDTRLDISIDCERGAFVYYTNYVIPESGRSITLTYLNRYGAATEYVFNVVHSIYIPSSHKKIGGVKFDGEQYIEFDTSVTEYSVKCESYPLVTAYGTEFDPEISYKQGGKTVTVKVFAEDGTSIVYTFRFYKEDEADGSADEQGESENSDTEFEEPSDEYKTNSEHDASESDSERDPSPADISENEPSVLSESVSVPSHGGRGYGLPVALSILIVISVITVLIIRKKK